MSNCLLSLLILAAQAAAPIDVAEPAAVSVYHCDFGEQHDANYDSWPDQWTRLRGPGYPQYLEVAIERQAEGEYLRMQLDGGAATAYTPPVPINPLYGYLLHVDVRTERLQHDVVYFAVTFLDGEQKPCEVHESRQVTVAPDWTRLQIGPIAPKNQAARTAIISLHLRPSTSADLFGSASFDNLWMGRLPRMTLSSNAPHNIFYQTGDAEISCQVSGILPDQPVVQFEVLDVFGNRLGAPVERPLQLQKIADSTSAPAEANANDGPKAGGTQRRADAVAAGSKPHQTADTSSTATDGTATDGTATSGIGATSSEATDGTRATDEEAGGAHCGSTTWKPPLTEVGFYRIRATLGGSNSAILQRETTVVILPTATARVDSEFGWTLPHDPPLDHDTLTELMLHAGVRWCKLPAWHPQDDPEYLDRTALLVERLRSQGIEPIGVFDSPPARLAKGLGGQPLPMAALLAAPELWPASIDPVVKRLGLNVRWWQLGSDDNAALAGLSNLPRQVRKLSRHLDETGYEMHVGLSWDWLREPPAETPAPWRYLAYASDPPLTAEALADYLRQNGTPPKQRWLSLAALARDQYDVQTRARDVVARILAAKMQNTGALFATRSFDDQLGLMHEDGTPGELLLPWRTAAFQLAGTRYVGSVTLPSGSQNAIFARGEEAVMVLWHDQPVTETVFLGDHVRQIDVWGRELAVATVVEDNVRRQKVQSGRLPTFLTGISLPVARWRMATQFDQQRLASISSQPQTLSYRFENFFPNAAHGQLQVVTSPLWHVQPAQARFQLAAGQEHAQQLTVQLRPDAPSGPQNVRLDFDVIADRSYRFSVYRTLEVGLGDVQMQLSTRLNELDQLVVDVLLLNNSPDHVSFNCLLYAPQRRRERLQLLDVPPGHSSRTIALARGRELLDKTLWLRAEEIGGQRLMNYYIVAEP